MKNYPQSAFPNCPGLEAALDRLPPAMGAGILRWALWSIPSGGFVRAVLENNLYSAAGGADDVNKRLLPEYAEVLNHLPPGSWGSRDAILSWRGVLHGVDPEAWPSEAHRWRRTQSIRVEEVKP